MEIFREDIRQKESVGIHQYAIQPIGHNDKPISGETLRLQDWPMQLIHLTKS